jgi:hypothetical protein
MTIRVKYLSEDEIEKDAELLLAEYEDTAGEPIKLPVPVADITTYHLALRLGFDDLHQTLRIPCCAANLTSLVRSGSTRNSCSSIRKRTHR